MYTSGREAGLQASLLLSLAGQRDRPESSVCGLCINLMGCYRKAQKGSTKMEAGTVLCMLYSMDGCSRNKLLYNILFAFRSVGRFSFHSVKSVLECNQKKIKHTNYFNILKQ